MAQARDRDRPSLAKTSEIECIQTQNLGRNLGIITAEDVNPDQLSRINPALAASGGLPTETEDFISNYRLSESGMSGCLRD